MFDELTGVADQPGPAVQLTGPPVVALVKSVTTGSGRASITSVKPTSPRASPTTMFLTPAASSGVLVVLCCLRTKWSAPPTRLMAVEAVALNSSEVLPTHVVLESSGTAVELVGSTKSKVSSLLREGTESQRMTSR